MAGLDGPGFSRPRGEDAKKALQRNNGDGRDHRSSAWHLIALTGWELRQVIQWLPGFTEAATIWQIEKRSTFKAVALFRARSRQSPFIMVGLLDRPSARSCGIESVRASLSTGSQRADFHFLRGPWVPG